MKKQNKFWFAIIVTLVLTVCSITFAEDVQVPVLIDGVRVAFFDQNGNLLQQKKVDDTVYVPLLSLCESMGMEAQVQGQSVSVNGMRIGMFDASGSFLSPMQFDGTDYVPLLAFCEATGVSAIEENGKLIISRAKQESTASLPQDTKGKVALHPYNFGDYFTYDIRVDEGSFKTVQTRTQLSDGFIYSNDSEVDFVLTCDARSVFEIEDISFDVFGTVYEASAQFSGINSVGFYEDMPASGTLTRTKHETGIGITAVKAGVPKLQSVTLGDVSGYVILSAEKAEAANEASYQSGIRYLESDNYKAAKAIFAALKQLDYPNSQEKYAEALEVEKIVIAAEKKALEAEKENNYQEALALEDEGSYEQALAMFEKLGTYKDCVERVKQLKNHIAEAELEDRYQDACAMEACGNKAGAFSAFKELGIYKDSNDCATNLAGFAKIAYAEHNTYSTEENENIRGKIQRSHTINYFYDTNGVLLSTKTTEQYPTEITYLYEDGRLISSVDRGALSITDGKISQYRRLESTYNANGDPITLAYVIEIVATKQEARSEGIIEYSYNEYGDKINREGFEINTFGNATYSYNYVYENGIKQEVSCVRNGEPYTKTYYEYDAYGCLEKELTVWYHYDGKTHYTELIYTY